VAASGQVLVDDAERAVDAALQERGDRRVGRLGGERLHEAPGREVAGELVVVVEEPAQHFALLGGILAAELAMLLGEHRQDHARLRDLGAVVELEHGHLAHLVDALAPGRVARRAAGELGHRHPHRLPRHAERAQQEGDLEGVARLGEAVQFQHLVSSPRSAASAWPRRPRTRA
jgi:hypothetical protein